MAGTFIKNKSYMAIKLETTSGTYSAPGSSDFDIQLQDLSYDPEIDFWMQRFASGRHSIGPGVMGKKKFSFSAKFALRAGAALGTAPKWGKVMKMCGQLETLVAVTSAAYTPVATKDEGDNITASVGFYLTPTSGNSLLITGKGAMGNLIITLDDLGQPFLAELQGVGAFNSIADGSALTMTSPDTSIPPAVIGSALTVAGSAVKIGKATLDFGNQVEIDYDPADATGYLAAYIADRVPKLTLNPKAELVATTPHYTRWAAGTELAVSLASATVSGQKITIAAPKAQLKAMKRGERNGEETFEQEYELHESSGNDSHSVSIS